MVPRQEEVAQSKKMERELRGVLRDAPETFGVTSDQLTDIVRWLWVSNPPPEYTVILNAFQSGVTKWLFPMGTFEREEKEYRGGSGQTPKDGGPQSPIMVKPRRKR
jgi:hypothetical protein